MNLNPGKTEFSPEEQAEVRAKVEAARANDNLTEADVARQAGVAAATLNQFMKGTYPSAPGRNNTAASLQRWLDDRVRASELRRRLPVRPTYRPLITSAKIVNRLAYAREVGRIVLITGAPGVSKTATARQFARDTPRTWYTVMDPSTAGAPTMLLEILLAMGEGDVKGAPQALVRRICQLAEVAKGLLIVDEAQHLSDKAIEQLRALNDRSGLGIAIFGNTEAYTKVGTTATKQAFAQVSSRISNRMNLARPDPQDVNEVAQAWAEANREQLGPEELQFLRTVAAKPGGLRNIEMTMEGALIAAFGDGEPLNLQHLRGAFGQLAGVGA